MSGVKQYVPLTLFEKCKFKTDFPKKVSAITITSIALLKCSLSCLSILKLSIGLLNTFSENIHDLTAGFKNACSNCLIVLKCCFCPQLIYVFTKRSHYFIDFQNLVPIVGFFNAFMAIACVHFCIYYHERSSNYLMLLKFHQYCLLRTIFLQTLAVSSIQFKK